MSATWREKATRLQEALSVGAVFGGCFVASLLFVVVIGLLCKLFFRMLQLGWSIL